ncbi:MAG: hypothetical protein HXY28_02315 [Hydrogenophilaceae bacterium]|jgi:hypothetical protein|nr:hypothetical protein [Hydrogenophilaceae bacterium]
MRVLEPTSFWRSAIALAALCAFAIALAARSDAALFIAAACAACATPILILRARMDRLAAAERRERARMADFDRQIVAIVERHAALLQRRKDMLAAAVERARLRPAWERDLARFSERLVIPAVSPLRAKETPDEILDRVCLVVDEVLKKRARVA